MGLRYLLILCVFITVFSKARAQLNADLEFGMAYHTRISTRSAGFDPGFSGASLRVAAGLPIQGFFLKPGLELGANSISNYLAATAGVYRQFDLKHPRLILESGLKTLQGAALFQQVSLYLFGFSEETRFSILTKKGRRLSVFLEARYLGSPAYKQYSIANSYFEVHSGLGFCFCSL